MSTPQPIEGLHDPGLPPFLTKTYDIVEDCATDHIVSWSSGNNSFIVWDPQTFSITLLPRYFKHSNFSSFVRQLNTYGFRKVDPDRWEFANEGFLRGQKQLLKDIRRRKTAKQPPSGSHQTLEACVEVGRFGLEAEMDRLRRDKQVLMMELVKLRNQQQTTKACLETMERRLRKTEKKQQQMMSFLAKSLQNPAFLQQLMQQKDKRRELEEAINKKRRRQIDQGNNIIDDQLGQTQNLLAGLEDEELVFVKAEPDQNCGITFDDQFQLLSNATDENVVGEVEVEDYSYDEMVINKGKEVVDEEQIWEDIFNGGANIDIQEIVDLGRVDDEEDMDVLVEQLEYLRSSPK